ncbi:hypothetical protein ABS71_02730 [bacterium SCN 62-11]|nr:hypothetical protein [Candidatus Eremiobacteraeota bacterium]ODT77125.1 MAG: hypothetical protein ABS71_02730 [bacterium SCN 62-11]
MRNLPQPKIGLECRPQEGKLLVFDPEQGRSFELPPSVYRVLGFCHQRLSLEEAILNLSVELEQSPEISHLNLALGLDFLQQNQLVRK